MTPLAAPTTTLKPLVGSCVAAARRATPLARRSTHATYPLGL
jgi:hypothetical protein